MTSTTREFLGLIEKHLRFAYQFGASTWVTWPHATGWRAVPSLIVCEIHYHSVIEIKDRKPVRVAPGEAFALPPGLSHNVSMTSRRAGYSHWIHFQCEVLEGVSLFDLVEPPLLMKGKQARKIGRINRDFAAIGARELSLASLLQRQALGWELVLTLLETVALKEERVDLVRHISRLTPALAYIEENLAKSITHEQLARAAHLSPSRFHFLFRFALGSAPYEYVQKMRLKKAQQLLLRTDRTIAEIGREVGHSDPYHFSRAFRRYAGISPAKYRQQMSVGSF